AADAGIPAADALCAAEARSAGLSGSFKALLASNGKSAASRFNLRGPPWVRVDGVAVVNGAADLNGGTVNAPIDVTAFGIYAINGFWAWMGTFAPGQPGAAGSTCNS